MSKKGLTVDENGKKKLETFIDDTSAVNNTDVAYSGKFIDDNLLSVSHESHVLGDKVVDEANINNTYVLNYNATDDKIEYTKVEDIIEEIDCGQF